MSNTKNDKPEFGQIKKPTKKETFDYLLNKSAENLNINELAKVYNLDRRLIKINNDNTIEYTNIRRKAAMEIENRYKENHGVLKFGFNENIVKRDYFEKCEVKALINKANIIQNLSRGGLEELKSKIPRKLYEYIKDRFHINSTVFINFDYTGWAERG